MNWMRNKTVNEVIEESTAPVKDTNRNVIDLPVVDVIQQIEPEQIKASC